jgi:hypothetical protein
MNVVCGPWVARRSTPSSTALPKRPSSCGVISLSPQTRLSAPIEPSQDTISDRVSIHERPKNVDARNRGRLLGGWPTSLAAGVHAGLRSWRTSRGRVRWVLPDQRKESAVVFLEATVAYFTKLDIAFRQRLLLPVKDFPSSLQTPQPSLDIHQALYCQDQRDGKARHPRALREWAYTRAFQISDQRLAAPARNDIIRSAGPNDFATIASDYYMGLERLRN